MKKLEKIERNAQAFVEHFAKVTVGISKWNAEGAYIGRCSGFLFQPSNTEIPLVITAGHELPEQGSFIETLIVKDSKSLLINAGEFKIFYSANTVDYAYSKLPVDLYRQEIERYKGVEFIAYQHHFVNAVKDESYGFSVFNSHEFLKNGSQLLQPLEYCYEVGLELVAQDESINYFKPIEFKGHDYYKGASGSPIADPEGSINSILVSGSEKDGLLRGFRLDNINFTFEEANN